MSGENNTSKEKENFNRQKETIVLSLGSNIGNSIQVLEKAIELISQRIGPLIIRSKIYKTEPWGFEGNSFYNLTAQFEMKPDIFSALNILKEIEIDLGRKRKSIGQVYNNRTIDIDILFNDQNTINLDELTIPHYLFHKRNFVLIPTEEILANFVPPNSDLNISQLLDICEDDTKCTPISL